MRASPGPGHKMAAAALEARRRRQNRRSSRTCNRVPSVHCGQVRAPTWSRREPRQGLGSKPGGGGPSGAFRSGLPLVPVSAAAAIIGPRVGGQYGGLDERSWVGERGRSGLWGPPLLPPPPPLCRAPTLSRLSPGRERAAGRGRSPGDGPARAPSSPPRWG